MCTKVERIKINYEYTKTQLMESQTEITKIDACIKLYALIHAASSDEELEKLLSDPTAIEIIASGLSEALKPYPFHEILGKYSYINLNRIMDAFSICCSTNHVVHGKQAGKRLIGVSRCLLDTFNLFLLHPKVKSHATKFLYALVQYRMQLDKFVVPSDKEIMRELIEEIVTLCNVFNHKVFVTNKQRKCSMALIETKRDDFNERFGEIGMRMLAECGGHMNLD